jgi:hypothetical protein
MLKRNIRKPVSDLKCTVYFQDGVNVPEPLQMYMPPKYKTFIPFVNAAPIDAIQAKKKGK